MLYTNYTRNLPYVYFKEITLAIYYTHFIPKLHLKFTTNFVPRLHLKFTIQILNLDNTWNLPYKFYTSITLEIYHICITFMIACNRRAWASWRRDSVGVSGLTHAQLHLIGYELIKSNTIIWQIITQQL